MSDIVSRKIRAAAWLCRLTTSASLVAFLLGDMIAPVYAAPPTRQGLNEAGFVKIGGIEQWVEIHGDNKSNPILLVVNGGPGATWDPMTTLFVSWEKYFTLVIWDQRGEGRTYARTDSHRSEDITIDRITADGIDFTAYLTAHLHTRKIVVLGHSWGSLIGIRMVQQRPDLFAAYVGTGQIVDARRAEIIAYRDVIARATATKNDTAVSELTAIGAPPYASARDMGTERKWANLLAVKSELPFNNFDYVKSLYPPDFTDKDMSDRIAGANFSFPAVYGEKLDGAIMSVNLLLTASELKVPVVFIQGGLDDVTPSVLVKEYYEKLQVPHKEMVILPEAGHLAVLTMPERFLDELRRRVLPLTGN